VRILCPVDAMVTAIGMVSKAWYDKLPADLQKILVAEGETACCR